MARLPVIQQLAAVSLLVLLLLLAVQDASGHGHWRRRPGTQSSPLGSFLNYQGLNADGVPGRLGFQRVGPAANVYTRGCLAMERCRGMRRKAVSVVSS